MTKTNRSRILLHACPRCQGDLFPDSDDVGFYNCLQCGRTVAEAQLITLPAVERERTPMPAAA